MLSHRDNDLLTDNTNWELSSDISTFIDRRIREYLYFGNCKFLKNRDELLTVFIMNYIQCIKK